MKTNDLIAMLATEASATPTVSPLRRCAQATAAGVAICLVLVLTLGGLVPQLDTLTHTQAHRHEIQTTASMKMGVWHQHLGPKRW